MVPFGKRCVPLDVLKAIFCSLKNLLAIVASKFYNFVNSETFGQLKPATFNNV